MKSIVLLVLLFIGGVIDAQEHQPSRLLPIEPSKGLQVPIAAPTVDLPADFRSSILLPSVDSLSIAPVSSQSSFHLEIPPFRYEKPHYNFRYTYHWNDYQQAGMIGQFDTGALFGSSSHTTLYGLGSTTSAATQLLFFPTERLRLMVGANASKYSFNGMMGNNFGVSASLRYQLTDHLSLNTFGSYQTLRQLPHPVAVPYLNSSNIGASINIEGELFGAELGAQSYYDPFLRRWESVPIVKPYVKINETPIGIDFGGLIKQLFINASQRRQARPMMPGGGHPVPGRPMPGFRPY